MSNVPTEQRSHPEDLLPWFVNGTLSEGEREEVESHIASCTRCQQEVSLLQQIRAQTKNKSIRSPGETGLHRLLHDVQTERKELGAQITPQKSRWNIGLAIAASFIIFIQAGLLIDTWFLSKPLVPLARPEHNLPLLQVSFVSSATAKQIQHVLSTVQGTIVDGPSSLGIYRVRLDRSHIDTQQLNLVVEQLRREATIIQHVAID